MIFNNIRALLVAFSGILLIAMPAYAQPGPAADCTAVSKQIRKHKKKDTRLIRKVERKFLGEDPKIAKCIAKKAKITTKLSGKQDDLQTRLPECFDEIPDDQDDGPICRKAVRRITKWDVTIEKVSQRVCEETVGFRKKKAKARGKLQASVDALGQLQIDHGDSCGADVFNGVSELLAQANDIIAQLAPPA